MIFLSLALALGGGVPADLRFEPWFTSHGVRVEICRTEAGTPWLRGTAEVSVPAARVVEALTDFVHYRELFSPAVKTAAVLERESDGARLHLVWPYPFPFRNRDAIVSYRLEKENGRSVLTWKDNARPGDPKEGVRIAKVEGETIVEPLGADRCRVTYTYWGDLGGKFPGWAQEKAWREEPVQYMRAIRRRLGIADPTP